MILRITFTLLLLPVLFMLWFTVDIYGHLFNCSLAIDPRYADKFHCFAAGPDIAAWVVTVVCAVVLGIWIWAPRERALGE